MTVRLIAVLILLGYSLSGTADQNDPALDGLFERLAVTTSDEEASNITREIWQRWTANDDPNISQLMQIGIRGLSYSSYRRALQTAELALEAGLASGLVVDEHLKPGGALETLLSSVDGRLGLVGHEPDLGDLACMLLGCPPGGLLLKKAGVIQLHCSAGQWQLQTLLRPALLIDDLGC